MANLPISGLTASAANLTATDVMPVVQTTGIGPVKMTGLQLAGGLLGSTALTGATVTTSKPVLDLSQTWNAGAVTFTGLKFNAAGTSDANSAAGSLLLDLQVGGVSYANIDKSGLITLRKSNATGLLNNLWVKDNYNIAIGSYAGSWITFNTQASANGTGGAGLSATEFKLSSAHSISWTGGGAFQVSADLFITRDAANTLALKNSTNPQIFRAYSTTTGPSYGYLAAGVTDAGVATADTLFLGTGGLGAAMTKLAFVVNGTTRADFGTTLAGGWAVNSANTDILAWKQAGQSPYGTLGAGGAGVSLNAYNVLAGFGFALLIGSTEYARFTSTGGLKVGSALMSAADPGNGVILCNQVEFGGTTSSFPALKRSSATLAVRLADDSANAALTCGTTGAAGTALNVTGTGDASIMSVTNTTTGTLFSVVNSSAATIFSVTDTVTTGTQVLGTSFGLSGNISAAAWTTSGIRYRNVAATLTDTSSSGTVAAAYTDLFGGNTIAASNATTFTDYYTMFVTGPTAGTNVTLTRSYAIGLGGALRVNASTAIPAGGAANTGVMVSSTAGFGVYFGSGAPTVSAAKGSLYLRSDGSTTNDRMYVNTDGGTTWTAVTTAA